MVKQAQGFFAGEAELAGFHRKLGSQRPEPADLFRAKQPRGLLIDIAAATGNGAQDSLAEILEGAGDGVGIHAELSGELAYRRERVVVAEDAGGDGVAHLVLNLEIDGNAGSGMDAKKHGDRGAGTQGCLAFTVFIQ